MIRKQKLKGERGRSIEKEHWTGIRGSNDVFV